MARINGVVTRLANDRPVIYTGSHTGAELTFEAGMAMADTWADYINIGMEHGPLDIPGMNRFMQGMASVRTPTPIVLVELPFEGREPDHVRANAWQIRQLLAVGVHGFLLCHAECPEAVAGGGRGDALHLPRRHARFRRSGRSGGHLGRHSAAIRGPCRPMAAESGWRTPARPQDREPARTRERV